MSTTPGGLPLMDQTENERYLNFNELSLAVDVLQRGVLDRDLTSPPGSPADGDAYIVGDPATGAWAGHENDITFYFGGIWNFLAPELAQGNGVFVFDEGIRLRWHPEGSPPAYSPVTGVVSSVNGADGAIVLNGGYIGVKWTDIASAGTTDLGAANGDFGDVTGTTTITALGTIGSGIERLVRFTGALTLTHNGTSLILPTGANITTAAGDTARFRSLGSGNWVCVSYQRKDGTALAGSGGGGGGAGALVLLESHTASSSSSLDFTTRNASGQSGATFQSDYDEYQLEFVNVTPATDNVMLYLRASTNGGSSFDSSTSYAYVCSGLNSAGGVQGGNETVAQIQLLSNNADNSSSHGICGSVKLFGPLGSKFKRLTGQFVFLENSGTYLGSLCYGAYKSATAVDAFRVLMSSGNIASGTIRVYGVAK